jgi:hypothetical protein
MKDYIYDKHVKICQMTLVIWLLLIAKGNLSKVQIKLLIFHPVILGNGQKEPALTPPCLPRHFPYHYQNSWVQDPLLPSSILFPLCTVRLNLPLTSLRITFTFDMLSFCF